MTASSSGSTRATRLIISQLNCRSLLGKLLALEQLMLHEWKSDIMFFSETWLQPSSTTDSHLSVDGFSYYRRDRVHRTHGGLLVYVKNSTPSRRRTELEDDQIECVTIEVTVRPLKLLLFCCYRPPDKNIDNFFNTLSSLMSAAENESAVLILMGDFNAKHQSWDTTSQPNPAGTRLKQLFWDFSLSQLVDRPTRMDANGNTFSTIDLFCITRPDLLTNLTVSAPISDHCSVHACLELGDSHSQSDSTSTISFPDFAAVDWASLRNAIFNSDLLQAIQGTTDVDVSWNVWKGILQAIIQRHVPMRSIVIKPKRQKWWNSALHQLYRTKQRLFKQAKRTRSTDAWTLYKVHRNKFTAACRKAKRSYFTHWHAKLEQEADGSTRWWRIAKDLSRLNTSKNGIPELEINGVAVSCDRGKADVLASFFAEQCTKVIDDDDLCGAPYPLLQDHPTFQFQPLSTTRVLRKLLHLPVSKSTADRLINNRLLRECALSIAPSITYLFNLSLSTNIFPGE